MKRVYWFLLGLVVLVLMGATLPPPILRQVLTTNSVAVGTAGQFLTRVGTDGLGFSNLAAHVPASGGDQVWTNDGRYVVPYGMKVSNTASIAIDTNSGTIYVGKHNYLDGEYSTDAGGYVNISLTDSNDVSLLKTYLSIVNNEDDYDNFASFVSEVSANTDLPAGYASSSVVLDSGDKAGGTSTINLTSSSSNAYLKISIWTGDATKSHIIVTNEQTGGKFIVSKDFDVEATGIYSGNGAGLTNIPHNFGSLMMNATNIVVCAAAASVYTNVSGTGFTTIVTNMFTGNTVGTSAALTNLVAGYYRITVCASALGQNNQATEWEAFTNNVACDLIGMKKTFDAAARMDDLSMTGIIYLPANCRTDFRVQDAGGGGSISIHRCSLTIGTP